MQNKFNRNAAVFAIISLLILVAFAPVINSSTVKNNTLFEDTITYDIYFGTTSPPSKVVSNQTETSYDPGTLEYNTTYYWQIVAWSEQGESAEGPIWNFTTETISPSVETLDANPVGKHNATLHGRILEDGGEQCQIRFRYRVSDETNWTYPSDWHGSYGTNDTFSEEIDGLNITTLYDFQAGAKNSIGEEWGEIRNFTTNANQQPVAIIVAPSLGNKKVDITFDGSDSYDSDGYIVEYLWDFGDGETGNGSIVTHQFQMSKAYTVILQVEDDDGDTDETSHTIVINNQAPVASISVDQQYIEPGDTVTFDGTDSYDPDGDSLSYEWKLGDGTVIGTESVISYTFNEYGTYEVILTVTDDDPLNPMCDTDFVMIYVNAPPIADFTYYPEDPYIFDVIEFDGSISYDPDGDIVNYTWDFDNGDYAYGEVVYYMYVSGGWYSVTLTVTDDDGATDSYTEEIFVNYIYDPLGLVHNSNAFMGTNVATDESLMKISSLGYPPKTPSDPYPEDGAINVPIDVILSWTGGEDNPPETPIITGETNGKVGEEYTYCIDTVVDPDGDIIYVYWDWGDGTNSGWLGPYASGEQSCADHSWSEEGTYTVGALLKDEHGVLSEWGYLEVTMPKNKMITNSLALQILEWLIKAVTIL